MKKKCHHFATTLAAWPNEEMKLSFNLRSKQSEIAPIYLVFTSGCHRIRVSTRQSIRVKYWNGKTQRSRDNYTYPEGVLINRELDRIMSDALDKLDELRRLDRHVGIDELKQVLYDVVENRIVRVTAKTFWDYFEEFLEYKKPRVSDSVIKDYHYSLRKHLKVMEKRMDTVLTFDQLQHSVNGFCDQLEQYLMYEALGADGQKGMSLNTVGKVNKNLKAFLNWCFERGVVERFSLKHLKTRSVEADAIYLTEAEISSIELLTLQDEQEETVRDLFLVGCETGMRFSEYTSLKPHHVDRNVVRVFQKKTGQKVTIPISQRFRRILEKYNYMLPDFENITIYNKTLREVARKAGIDDQVLRKHSKGNNQTQEVYPKYELITSHTARRSFCTNKFLKEMPAQAIMTFTGHKSERTFMRYLKIDSEMAAVKYAEYF